MALNRCPVVYPIAGLVSVIAAIAEMSGTPCSLSIGAVISTDSQQDLYFGMYKTNTWADCTMDCNTTEAAAAIFSKAAGV